MCLYPKLIANPKYKPNKKNGGKIPAVYDKRVLFVPIGCQLCYECKRKKANEWMVRLNEDIKVHTNGHFVTLTFSTDSLIYLKNDVLSNNDKLTGYDLDNAIVTRACRLFLERWRKKTGKSVRHFFISELGSGRYEHIHMHGIIWTDNIQLLKLCWNYGYVWDGHNADGRRVDWVSGKTINYILKYFTKMDFKHKFYQPVILCSSGIGGNYVRSKFARDNEYKPDGATRDYYKTDSGHKIGLPIYFRNKLYSDEVREKLWIEKIDKGIRFVNGVKVAANDFAAIINLLDIAQERNRKLGFGNPNDWRRKVYEDVHRNFIHGKRFNVPPAG